MDTHGIRGHGSPSSQGDHRRVRLAGPGRSVGVGREPAGIDRRAPGQLVAAQTEDPLGGGVPLRDPTVVVLQNETFDQAVDDQRLLLFAQRQFDEQITFVAALQLLFDQRCEMGQDALLTLVEVTRLTIDDAQRPDGEPVAIAHDLAGVEWSTSTPNRVVAEPRQNSRCPTPRSAPSTICPQFAYFDQVAGADVRTVRSIPLRQGVAMRARPAALIAAALLVPLAAACGSGSGAKPVGTSAAASTAAASSTKPSTATSAAPTKAAATTATAGATNAPAKATTPSTASVGTNTASTVAAVEEIAPGDIPDNQAFVAYSPPSGGYSIKVPEGWARTTDGAATVFSDKFNSIRVETLAAATAPTVASVTDTDLAPISTAKGFKAGKVSSVKRKVGAAILATYQVDGAANSVTDKIVRLDVERYVFWRNGTAAVVTLSGSAGSDNVDPWKIVTDGFSWA